MERGDTLILEAMDFKDPQHWRRIIRTGQYN
jgi:hypothetical protein